MNARKIPRSAPVDGSAALSMEPNIQAPAGRPSPPRQQQKRSVEKKPQGYARHQAQREPEPERSRRTAPVLMLGILAVAAVVVMTLVSYAHLVVVNDQVVSLRSQLTQLQSDQTKLQAEYELAYDLQQIETEMLNSGQMNKIQSWQTYTLELSEPDAVEYYQASNLKEEIADLARNFLTAVKEYF